MLIYYNDLTSLQKTSSGHLRRYVKWQEINDLGSQNCVSYTQKQQRNCSTRAKKSSNFQKSTI